MPQLAPTGTVTLAFTDIQGSTELWERLGDAFKEAPRVRGNGNVMLSSVTERALEAKALGEELKLDRHVKHGPRKGEVTEFWRFIDEVLGGGANHSTDGCVA